MKRPRLPRVDPARASVLVGIVAACVVAVLVNVVAARRYSRWDLTTNKRYTLSAATVQTLHDLPDDVQVWVLLGPDDTIEQSVKQLLVSYMAETRKLDVHYVDPDRDVAALEDVKKRFSIETGRTEQGHVVADAIVVVAHGDRHWFLGTADMVEVSSTDDTRVKPKEEQALTGAIRNVLVGEKARLCFTTGHGEMSPADAGQYGADALREVLAKDNYEIDVVEPGSLKTSEPFKGCAVAIVAGLRGAFANDEAERLRSYLLGGGSLLLAASPIGGPGQTGLENPGLERALAPFGVALDDDLVIEPDPERAAPGGAGVRFVAEPMQHPVTAGLVKPEVTKDTPRVLLDFARSMHRVAEPGAATAVEILASSPKAFGVTSLVGAADWKDVPDKRPGDLAGPLILAVAAERAKVDAAAPHGPRAVVIGSTSVLQSQGFREPLPMRGAALLVESAISWLASKPQVLDVPERSAVAAGVHMNEESRSELRRYVLLFMPGAFALAGILIGLTRRAGSSGKPGKKRASRRT